MSGVFCFCKIPVGVLNGSMGWRISALTGRFARLCLVYYSKLSFGHSKSAELKTLVNEYHSVYDGITNCLIHYQAIIITGSQS